MVQVMEHVKIEGVEMKGVFKRLPSPLFRHMPQ